MNLPPVPQWLTMQAKKAWTAAVSVFVALVTAAMGDGGADALLDLSARSWWGFLILSGLTFLSVFNAPQGKPRARKAKP